MLVRLVDSETTATTLCNAISQRARVTFLTFLINRTRTLTPALTDAVYGLLTPLLSREWGLPLLVGVDGAGSDQLLTWLLNRANDDRMEGLLLFVLLKVH